MDISLFRGWLLVIGALIILVVLIDGYRRMRKSRRNSIKLAIDKNFSFKDSDRVDYYNGELPGGSARVVKRSAYEGDNYVQDEDDDLQDDEAQDELESEINDGYQDAEYQEDKNESYVNEVYQDEDLTDSGPEHDAREQQKLHETSGGQAYSGAPVRDDEDLMPDPLFIDDDEVQHSAQTRKTAQRTASPPRSQNVAPKKETARPRRGQPKNPPRQQEAQASTASIEQREIEEVIAINVFAPEDEQFKGTDLAGVVLACGMRFGDMDIFHRNEGKNGSGEVQFSMANAVKPGYFDIDNMSAFATPCVSFFMSLPGPKHSMAAFDAMLETARCVAKNLGGELRDEQHSTLTSQTIEHNRQKIRDYERRQLSLLN